MISRQRSPSVPRRRQPFAERGLRLKHPEVRVRPCAGHLHALGSRIERSGVCALPRAMRRMRRRVARAPASAACATGVGNAAASGWRDSGRYTRGVGVFTWR